MDEQIENWQHLMRELSNLVGKNEESLWNTEADLKKLIATKMFLEICDQNDGNLISIDILDCSKVSDNPRWKFIHSSDDNFEVINQHLNKNIDVLLIDSLHEPNHIRNVFYNYFKYLKINGLIFIDDVVWLPYVKGEYRDSEFVENINRRTFDKILEIYNSNKENMKLDINFNGSGLAIIKKIKDLLNDEKKIKNRSLSLKNIIKKIYSPKPKN